MNNGANHESKLWDILTKERLADLSQFHKRGFFDEVPLFSRKSDIAFPFDDPSDEADSFLVGFALKFLKAVVSYEEHRSQYLAAISFWSSPEGDRLIPNLFVWSGSVRTLRSRLVLESPTTPFAKKIKRMISQTHGQRGFEVLQDTATNPDEIRVFVSLLKRPYKGFVPLHEFRKQKAVK